MATHSIPLIMIPPFRLHWNGELSTRRGRRGKINRKPSLSMTYDNDHIFLPSLNMAHVLSYPKIILMSISGHPSLPFLPSLPPSSLIQNHSSSRSFTLQSPRHPRQRFAVRSQPSLMPRIVMHPHLI